VTTVTCRMSVHCITPNTSSHHAATPNSTYKGTAHEAEFQYHCKQIKSITAQSIRRRQAPRHSLYISARRNMPDALVCLEYRGPCTKTQNQPFSPGCTGQRKGINHTNKKKVHGLPFAYAGGLKPRTKNARLLWRSRLCRLYVLLRCSVDILCSE
jgi:hypothetical protein